MKENVETKELIAVIEKTITLIDKNLSFYNEFLENDLKKLGRNTSAAMVMSQIFADFYTCVETLFLRITQFFGNGENRDSWHKDMLQKMNLDIEDVRIAVISDKTFDALDEILRFRHFRRYYFNFNYDWDRLDLVEKKYLFAATSIKNDLQNFKKFLEELIK